jgi:tetrapyrrole methylase family protein/MazG family protein
MDPSETPTIHTLRRLIARLNEPAPAGCPWCLAQTPQTLAEELVKESHEALAAAVTDSQPGLMEELGDVLLLVLTEAHLAEAAGSFTLTQLIGQLQEKLVRRHPHIFGDAVATTADEAVQQWQAVKREEGAGDRSLLEGIPPSLPALMRADEIQQRAAHVGFDWPDLAGVVAKVQEEADELVGAESAADREEELGDLFFALVNLGRKMGISSEVALQRANEKFTRRFTSIEAACRAEGARPEELTLEQLDALWEQAKADERQQR